MYTICKSGKNKGQIYLISAFIFVVVIAVFASYQSSIRMDLNEDDGFRYYALSVNSTIQNILNRIILSRNATSRETGDYLYNYMYVINSTSASKGYNFSGIMVLGEVNQSGISINSMSYSRGNNTLLLNISGNSYVRVLEPQIYDTFSLYDQNNSINISYILNYTSLDGVNYISESDYSINRRSFAIYVLEFSRNGKMMSFSGVL